MRQALAAKVCGNLVGLWLLLAEHLRLGTWELLTGWCGQAEGVAPRLALQLVHEAALCLTGLREARSLRQRGFELANGLPFVATDVAMHQLLSQHTVLEAQTLQIALGRRRLGRGHFLGRVLIVDPHRVPSGSRRHMRRHKKGGGGAAKVAQTFFCLDADTKQPLGFVTGTSARTVTQATPEVLELAAAVVGPGTAGALVLADAEHFSAALIDRLHQDTRFDLLVPMPLTAALLRRLRSIPDAEFTRHWAGYATAWQEYTLTHSEQGPFFLIAQRLGERAAEYTYNAFLCTQAGAAVQALTVEYPKRWHVEEFFNNDQALGWDRAGTQNLHIRYAHMTMSLLAQAALMQLRQRLGEPEAGWESRRVAEKVLGGLEGDIRVEENTIVVTYYNAPQAERLQGLYAGLPSKLRAEGIDPRIPWLYDFHLDFRFR